MASPFDSITIQQIQEALQPVSPAWIADNRAFYAGDHWQSGRGWVGPQPGPGDPDFISVLLEIQRAFVAKNVIGEGVGRHVAGVIGREPDWGFTPRRPLKQGKKPTQAEQALIDEAVAALVEWWDTRNLHALLEQATATLLLSGRASLRLFVPAGVLDEGGQVPAGTLAESLSRIYVHHPDPSQAIVITHAASQQQAACYIYKVNYQTVAEVSYVDLATGTTVLRILDGDPTRQAFTLIQLGGRLLIHEMQREALITEPVRQQQKLLNMARTMQGRNVVQGGFLERIFLNAQMPGDRVEDPNGPIGPDGRRATRFVPRPLKTGAGRTNFVSGQAVRDKDGNITDYTPASVVFRDPVDVETFERTATSCYRGILEEVRQAHALIASDATASAVSRVQARADFAQSLTPTKTQLDKLIRGLLETALTLGAIFSLQPGRYAALRATANARIDTGPLTPEERQQIVSEVEKGAMSLETALTLLGHDDPEAELARIAAEKAARVAEATKIAQATQPAEPAEPKADEPDGDRPAPTRDQPAQGAES